MWQDLRISWRTLRKRPGFCLIVVFTLSLGIGANTAIFSVVNAVLLSSLPYRDADRLVALYAKNEKKDLRQRPVSYANFKDWRAQSSSFAQLAAMRGESFSLIDGSLIDGRLIDGHPIDGNLLPARPATGTAIGSSEPERVNGVRVTTNILSLLGVEPIAGRDFSAQEEEPALASVALISSGLWQRRYSRSPQVIGQPIVLEGRAFTIIGVLPAWLKHPALEVIAGGAEVWIPFVPLPSELNRSFANTRIIAKLAPGVSLERAQSEFDLIATRLEKEYPGDNANLGIEMIPLDEALTGRVRLGLWILLGAVCFVLLIACVNVANLLLARASGRRTEIAIRAALGASRYRVVRQLLTECLLLALGGSAMGLFLAWLGVEWLARTKAGNIPRIEEISINGRVLVFTLLLSCLTTLLFGLVPALQASRLQLLAVLKEGRKGAGGAGSRRSLSALAVAEVALALVLLVGAGLLVRSFQAISEVDPGFRPDNLLTLSVPLPQAGYPDQAAQYRFYEELLARLKNLPEIEAVAAVFRVPLVGLATAIFTVQGQPLPPGTEPNADYRPISPDYFRAMGMQLLRGRQFDERDTVDSADVVIVNEELARRHWPGEDPIGKRLQIALERTRWREVVGIVSDARLSGLEARVDPAIYLPISQNSWPNALRTSSIVIRTSADVASVTASLGRELRAVNPALPITQVRTMNEILDSSLAPRRFNMSLLLIFATVAGLLALIGIYGVASYSVAARTNEIGIRLALGAQRADILKLVLFEGMKVTLAGVLLGLGGAFALTRLMSGLLFGVSAADPAVYTSIAALLAVTAMVAVCLPARRAARVDPVCAIRSDSTA